MNMNCREIIESGIFSSIDLVFARFVAARVKPESPILFLAAALASHLMQQGHSCCDLKAVSGSVWNTGEEEGTLLLPEFTDFQKALRLASDQGMAAWVPTQKIGTQPLILDSAGRLYLNRYYGYEQRIAAELARRCRLTRNYTSDWSALPEPAPGKLAGLTRRFQGKNELDYQQAAVFLAHSRNFTIITGGPGTGKTTVLTALLAWEIEDCPEIRIELCAPTGKAQNRMKESIAAELRNNQLVCPDEVKKKLADLNCRTVDSLLHPIPHTPNYRRSRKNPIPADLVVLDEVSMSSLSQLGHLLDALKPETRLILIGDRNQLSPVEAGAVLGDLIASGTANVMPPELAEMFERQTHWKFPSVADSLPLSGCIAELQVNYRAKDAPEICEIADRMRNLELHPEQIGTLGEKILSQDSERFSVKDFCRSRTELNAAVRSFLTPAREMIREAENGTWNSLQRAFLLLDSFKILCAVRRGPFGVENINRMAAEILNMRSPFQVGTPLMILENTPALNLFNGDIGLVWKNKEDAGMSVPETMVMFRCIQPDGTAGYRAVRLSELPPHETVFAMTVHKSQGSGFQRVMIILPQKVVPVLTRELLYTAITRAERNVLLCTGREILLKMLQNKTIRYSGLPDQLKTKKQEERSNES